MLQNLGTCVLLEGFTNFSVDPYYDPLSLVMINSKAFAIPILTAIYHIKSSQNRDSKCFRIYLLSFFNDPRALSLTLMILELHL